MKKYNTIIFDVDGTLINTRQGIMASVKHVIDNFNLKQLSDDELYKFVGLSPLQAAFCHFCNIDKNLSQKCTEEFRMFYNKNELYNANIYNGISKLLDFLKSNNYKLGVATYKREDLVINLLNHFKMDKYFDYICGADNENKLSKTEMINNCIKIFNTDKADTIVIGDSKHDAEAAMQLGIDFIGVTYGFGFKVKNDVNVYPNILCAETPQEILNYVRS